MVTLHFWENSAGQWFFDDAEPPERNAKSIPKGPFSHFAAAHNDAENECGDFEYVRGSKPPYYTPST